MSDFFTHLAGQVFQPSTDVIPNIPLRFTPGAAVPGSALAAEPPVLEPLLQPAPAASADRMGADQSSPTLVDAPVIPKALAAEANLRIPVVSGAQFLPDHAKAEKDYPAAGKGRDVENAAPAPTSAPHETWPIASPITLPVEGKELARTPARPSSAQPPASVPSVVLPVDRPAGRPETQVGQSLSAGPAADPEGPGATEKLLFPIVRPASSVSPLEPLEPPVGQPSSAAPGSNLPFVKASANSLSPHQPLAAPEAGEIAQPSQARTGAKTSTTPLQPEPPQKSQQADFNSLPEILPLVKPAAAQTILPPASLSPAAPTPASPEVKHAAAEAAVPQVKAALPAAAISDQTPAADRIELNLAAPLSHADFPGQPISAPPAERVQRAKRAQIHPVHSPADPPPAPIKAIDPQPMDAAGPTSPAAQRPPGNTDPRPAPKPEVAAEQPLFSLELNSKSLIRPVLEAETPPDNTIPSRHSGADQTTIPTLHLTIGRIVVRTAPPAAPAASRPAPIRRQPAISLHDYLNRHGGDK